MGSAVKSAFGGPARQLLCCISADFAKEKDSGTPRCLRRDRAPQQVQKQQNKRDAVFAQHKAERASMRAHLREKYQLPKNRTDKKQLEAAGVKTKLPQDLLAIVNPKAASEPGSIFPNLGGLDFSAWRTTAESAMHSLQRPVQCPVM
ncbi:complexin-3-like [Elgaria multicarinata webbii]|uniref:complexin-3-like n=1 Tax=Elgaria multicarinata webbii TaxID=159646 RepID=UPI002FCCDAC6